MADASDNVSSDGRKGEGGWLGSRVETNEAVRHVTRLRNLLRKVSKCKISSLLHFVSFGALEDLNNSTPNPLTPDHTVLIDRTKVLDDGPDSTANSV